MSNNSLFPAIADFCIIEQKGSLPCVQLLLDISGHVDNSCFGSFVPNKSNCLDYLVNWIIRTGVAPKRLEKFLGDILYGAGDIPELVDLLLKHGASPSQAALTTAASNGHTKVRNSHCHDE